MANGPLRDIRILDLTHVWAGPLATRVLADLGATVVKVESPFGRGPREFKGGLPIGGWLGGKPPAEPWNVNAVFVKLQRNKQSLAIDLKTPEGKDAFLQLVGLADVVIENFSARAMPELGLGYEQLSEANPRLIYVAMPGFGKRGPYRDRVAFGPSVESMSGLTTVMGYAAGEPKNTAVALMDPINAVTATGAVLDALRRRERTGKGAYVEMSLHEGGVAYSGPWLIESQLADGRDIVALGNRHPDMAPHGVYRCAGDDAWVAIACRHDADWRALCTVIPVLEPTLAFSERRQCHDVIDATIGAWTAAVTKQEAAETLQNAGVPAGAVNITPDMTADSQVMARGFFVPLEPGPTPIPGNPIKMRGISSDDWTPCPRLGADNGAVLKDWLGYDTERIEALESGGVLVDKPPK